MLEFLRVRTVASELPERPVKNTDSQDKEDVRHKYNGILLKPLEKMK